MRKCVIFTLTFILAFALAFAFPFTFALHSHPQSYSQSHSFSFTFALSFAISFLGHGHVSSSSTSTVLSNLSISILREVFLYQRQCQETHGGHGESLSLVSPYTRGSVSLHLSVNISVKGGFKRHTHTIALASVRSRSLGVDVLLVHRGGGGRGALAGVHFAGGGGGGGGSEGHMAHYSPTSQSDI